MIPELKKTTEQKMQKSLEARFSPATWNSST